MRHRCPYLDLLVRTILSHTKYTYYDIWSGFMSGTLSIHCNGSIFLNKEDIKALASMPQFKELGVFQGRCGPMGLLIEFEHYGYSGKTNCGKYSFETVIKTKDKNTKRGGELDGWIFSHIVDNVGCFTMDSIENLGDAHEALEECFQLIMILSEGDEDTLNEARLRETNIARAKYGHGPLAWVTRGIKINNKYKKVKSVKEKADELLGSAYEYWEAAFKANIKGAVKWLQDTDGRLLIFTRGEYTDQLMANIGTLAEKKIITKLEGETLGSCEMCGKKIGPVSYHNETVYNERDECLCDECNNKYK